MQWCYHQMSRRRRRTRPAAYYARLITTIGPIEATADTAQGVFLGWLSLLGRHICDRNLDRLAMAYV